MRLTGQAAGPSARNVSSARLDDAGFVMVALLVAIAMAAVWMGAALPSWRHQVQREKEAELVFRGESIARAIYLYRQKTGQSLPPSLDILVSRRFLRKKYIDPITGKDFLAVAGATQAPGGATFGAMQGGIIGVRSTSNDTSIRLYNNQQTYSLWAFDFSLEQMRSGGGPVLGPVTVPDGRGRTGGPGGVGGGGRRGGAVAPGGGRGGVGQAAGGGRGGIQSGAGRQGRGGVTP